MHTKISNALFFISLLVAVTAMESQRSTSTFDNNEQDEGTGSPGTSSLYSMSSAVIMNDAVAHPVLKKAARKLEVKQKSVARQNTIEESKPEDQMLDEESDIPKTPEIPPRNPNRARSQDIRNRILNAAKEVEENLKRDGQYPYGVVPQSSLEAEGHNLVMSNSDNYNLQQDQNHLTQQEHTIEVSEPEVEALEQDTSIQKAIEMTPHDPKSFRSREREIRNAVKELEGNLQPDYQHVYGAVQKFPAQVESIDTVINDSNDITDEVNASITKKQYEPLGLDDWKTSNPPGSLIRVDTRRPKRATVGKHNGGDRLNTKMQNMREEKQQELKSSTTVAQQQKGAAEPKLARSQSAKSKAQKPEFVPRHQRRITLHVPVPFPNNDLPESPQRYHTLPVSSSITIPNSHNSFYTRTDSPDKYDRMARPGTSERPEKADRVLGGSRWCPVQQATNLLMGESASEDGVSSYSAPDQVRDRKERRSLRKFLKVKMGLVQKPSKKNLSRHSGAYDPNENRAPEVLTRRSSAATSTWI